MSFEALGISEDFCKGLTEMGITKPTKIQQAAIPLLIQGTSDFVGLAQTGTGKTAAFGLPLLSQIHVENKVTQGLILAPTRELGQQIQKQLFKYTKYSDKIFSEAVYGGEKIDKQIERLKRPTHIIVATPGRLVDMIRRKAVDLYHVKTVILDEADEMLSMGFKEDLTFILDSVKEKRRLWLFSATMPKTLNDIVLKYIRPSADRVVMDGKSTVNENIDHKFVIAENALKFDTLMYFLKAYKGQHGILFCTTKVVARQLHEGLEKKGFDVGILEGDMNQKERDKVMRAFKKRSLQLLVSTDVAARGIDVADLAFVVHFQLPDQTEYYTHRAGRTARAGKKGLSMALVAPNEMTNLRNLEKTLKIKFTKSS